MKLNINLLSRSKIGIEKIDSLRYGLSEFSWKEMESNSTDRERKVDDNPTKKYQEKKNSSLFEFEK